MLFRLSVTIHFTAFDIMRYCLYRLNLFAHVSIVLNLLEFFLLRPIPTSGPCVPNLGPNAAGDGE